MDCQMPVNDVFWRCLLERHDAVCHLCAARKTVFGGNARLQPADPGIAHFLKQPTAACPRFVTHAGQVCPQFEEIGKSWARSELSLDSFRNECPRETDLWNTAVGTRLCRATLSCLEARDGACKKNLLHPSPLVFRPGFTKCNVCATSRRPMVPEAITPRVVAVCDAVARRTRRRRGARGNVVVVTAPYW